MTSALIDPTDPYPMLTFCALHPWVAFLLAWPICFCIISWAWFFARVVEHCSTLLSNSLAQFLNTAIILIRGYPSTTTAAAQDASRNDDERGDGPLAG